MSDEYCRVNCIRLAFGVPLEDIFPPNDIHPMLKNLFDQIYLSVLEDSLNLTTIVKILTHDSFLAESAEIEEDLIKIILSCKCESNPGTLLGVLRHFLKLMPLPLFPKFSNGEIFKWEEIAVKFKSYPHVDIHELNKDIFWSIKRLPRCHKILINYIMNLFRKLCAISNINSDEPIYKNRRKCIISISKYFSSALFPEVYNNKDKLNRMYFLLTYHLIRNWKSIVTSKTDYMNCWINKLPSGDNCTSITEKTLFLQKYDRLALPTNITNNYIVKKLKDISCQTSIVNYDGNKQSTNNSANEENEECGLDILQECSNLNVDLYNIEEEKTSDNEIFNTCIETLPGKLNYSCMTPHNSNHSVSANETIQNCQKSNLNLSNEYKNFICAFRNENCYESRHGHNLKSSSEISKIEIKDSKLNIIARVKDDNEQTNKELTGNDIFFKNVCNTTTKPPTKPKTTNDLKSWKSRFNKRVATKYLAIFKNFTGTKAHVYNKLTHRSLCDIKYKKLMTNDCVT